MLSSKQLQRVFRMSVVTLIALGTYSYVLAQAQYNATAVPQTQEQIQAQSQQQSANQKSGGTLFGKLFGSSDSPKNTNQHVAPANAAQPMPQSQPVPQQQYSQPVQPPRPKSGGYPATGSATGARTPPSYQPVTSVSASQQYGTTQSLNQRPPLSQAISGSTVGSQGTTPSSTLSRMRELQDRVPEISPPNTNAARSSASGLPSPPPVAGSDPEPTQTRETSRQSVTANNEKSISTDTETGTKVASRNSISTDSKSLSTETPPTRSLSGSLATPPVVPSDDKTSEADSEKRSGAVREPVTQEQTSQRAPQPLSQSRPTPIPRQEDSRSVSKNDGGLITLQSPVLSVDLQGPKAMIVGKEETYKFVVANSSSVPAEGVVLNIDLPRWAQNTQPPELSTGSTRVLSESQNDDYEIFQWQVGPIAPNKSETLKLHIMLSDKRPFELKYNIDFKNRASHTKIDVQQPVLKMEFEGADEVIWGAEESYRLKIRNIGNGDATDLDLRLSTSGVVKAETIIPSLKVGEEKVLEVIVEAQEMDELQIKVEATGLYGLSEETVKRVMIKRAALELDIDAPGMQYVDNTLDYVLIARNTGTTASLNTVVEASLPLGVKFVSCTHNGEYDSDTNRVQWDAGTLPINGEFVCTVICEAKREGECRLDARVTEKTGLAQTANAVTSVDAIADIILEIDKPQDPIEVGATTEYVVTITNRGSKAADNIEVGVYFASAIEPIDVIGGRAKIDVEGREVVLDRIPILSAREKLTYKIKGRGLESGRHKVNAILVCQSAETELNTQITSRFYQDQRNSKTTPSALARDTQPLRDSTSAIAQGSLLRDDRNTLPPTNLSATAPGVQSMSRPGPNPQGSLAMAPTAVNPLANPGPSAGSNTGLPSSRMQGATVDGGSTVPVMQIPDMNFNQQPITAPTPSLSASPGRLQRTTGVPALSPPPAIGTTD